MAASLVAFDSFGILIRYLTEQLSAFSNPILSVKLDLAVKRCSALEEGVKRREKEIRDLLSVKEMREGDLADEIDQWKRELDASLIRHKNEKDRLLDMHEAEMKLLQDRHESELRMWSERERAILSQVDEREKRISEKNQEVSHLNDRIRDLEGSLTQNKDKRMKALNDKLKLYEDEISSLKVVLELRDEKLRSQNVQVMQLEEMCKELPAAKQSICLLRQKLEQLEISMDKKTDQIKRLFAENQELRNETECTIREKKRLSLRNEELEFVISESFIASTPASASAACAGVRPSLNKSASLSQVPSSSSSYVNGFFQTPAAATTTSSDLFGMSEPQTPIECLSEGPAAAPGAVFETPVMMRRKNKRLPAPIPFSPPQEVNESNESATSAASHSACGDMMLMLSGDKRSEEIEKDSQMTAIVKQQEEEGEHEEEQASAQEEQENGSRHRPDLENMRGNSCTSSSPSSYCSSSLPPLTPPVFIALHASPPIRSSTNGSQDQPANLVTSTTAHPTSEKENNDYDYGNDNDEEDEVVVVGEEGEEGEDRIILHSHEEAESESGFHSHDARLENLMQQHHQHQSADANPPLGSANGRIRREEGEHQKCNLQNNIRPYFHNNECNQSEVLTTSKSCKSAQESSLSNRKEHHHQHHEGEKNDAHDDEENGDDDGSDALSESLNPYPCVRINGTCSEKKIRT
jgi:hypothetical protein